MFSVARTRCVRDLAHFMSLGAHMLHSWIFGFSTQVNRDIIAGGRKPAVVARTFSREREVFQIKKNEQSV